MAGPHQFNDKADDKVQKATEAPQHPDMSLVGQVKPEAPTKNTEDFKPAQIVDNGDKSGDKVLVNDKAADPETFKKMEEVVGGMANKLSEGCQKLGNASDADKKVYKKDLEDAIDFYSDPKKGGCFSDAHKQALKQAVSGSLEK